MQELAPIEVRRYGAMGPEVVVLHGGPGAPGSAVGLARALAARFTVLEPLQRRAGEIPLTVAQHVDDLLQVADLPSVVVGHSWGAMLGLSFAARYPERVSKLVLVGCGTYDEVARAQFRDNVAAGWGEHDVISDSDEGAATLPFDELGHAETWQDVLRLQREGGEPQIFSRITARVLMIQGAQDPHPGAATRDLLRQYVPGLEYVELDRCGHEPWRERHAAEPFLTSLAVWLERS